MLRSVNFEALSIKLCYVNDSSIIIRISFSAQNLSTAESINLLSAIIQQNPQIVGLLSNLSSAIPTINPPDVLPHATLPNSVFRTAVQNQISQIPMEQYAAKRKLILFERLKVTLAFNSTLVPFVSDINRHLPLVRCDCIRKLLEQLTW